MQWTKRYKQSHHNYLEAKAPGFYIASGGSSMLTAYPKVTSSNGLSKAICNFMKWEGHHMERTNNMGRPIQKKVPKFSLISGKVEYLEGGIEWQKGTGIKGSSDLKGHISSAKHKFGIPCYIEVKWNKDKQSMEQKEYQKTINNTKGIYYIAKDIDSFFSWYDQLLLSL